MLKFIKTYILVVSVLLLSISITGCAEKTGDKSNAPQSEVANEWEQLALTPPMGWNSWNSFGVNVSEQVLREVADVMVASGLKEAGY